MKKPAIALLVGLLLAVPAAVKAQYTCTTNAGTLTITGYSGSGGAVTIPTNINSLTVTGIGANAFYYSTNITSIAIPWSITTIGANAFYYCTNLSTVTISSNVASIGSQAFFVCPKLASITIDPNNLYYSGLNGVLFNYAKTALIQYPPAAAGATYTIPNSVTSIGDWAFYDSPNLTTVTIPTGVASIGQSTFYSCLNLANITIPSTVTNIGLSAFAACFDLASIPVNSQNTFYSSSNGVLFNYGQTTLVEYPGGKTGSYSIPDSVTNIAQDAFLYAINLAGVAIPSSVNSIGFFAFEDCTSLSTLTIPDSVTNIGLDAFFYCTNLGSIYFTGNAPTLESVIFYANNNASVYYLPGTTNWTTPFGGLPALLWNPVIQANGPNFGVQGSQFGFNVTGTTNIPVLVEACSNLANPVWSTRSTFKLTNGLVYFQETEQAGSPSFYYRLRSP